MSAGLEALTGPHLWRGRAGCSAQSVRVTGFDALDRALGGGWPWGAVVEIFVERYGCGELSLLMPALAALSAADEAEPGFFVFVAPPWIPYPPALIRRGVDVGRILVVERPAAEDETLWATEQAVRSGASAAVLAWLGSANDTELRRLQLSAEERGCGLMLFRPERALRQRSPAALRLKVSVERNATRVDVVKRRGGAPQSLRLDLFSYASQTARSASRRGSMPAGRCGASSFPQRAAVDRSALAWVGAAGRRSGRCT
ncbi:MAG TPA: translesion DNA synthesis-associated protein ImuA [Gammaproteobacteria bacterium]